MSLNFNILTQTCHQHRCHLKNDVFVILIVFTVFIRTIGNIKKKHTWFYIKYTTVRVKYNIMH